MIFPASSADSANLVLSSAFSKMLFNSMKQRNSAPMIVR